MTALERRVGELGRRVLLLEQRVGVGDTFDLVGPAGGLTRLVQGLVKDGHDRHEALVEATEAAVVNLGVRVDAVNATFQERIVDLEQSLRIRDGWLLAVSTLLLLTMVYVGRYVAR